MSLEFSASMTEDVIRGRGRTARLPRPEDWPRPTLDLPGLARSFQLPPAEGGPLAVTARLPRSGRIDFPPSLPSALERACLAAKIASDNKGQDVLVLDMRKVTPMYDFFVIATGASKRQVHAIVEEVDEKFTKLGDVRIGLEGYEASKWVVQDYGDVMLHVFDPDSRAYYQLEELWNDAEKVDWQAVLDDAGTE
jgi:ribosome-associated protein